MAIRQTVHDLREVLRKLKVERAARIAAIEAEYNAQIEGLEAALHQMNGGPPIADQQPHTELSISDDRLEFIRSYVQERGEVRQADVTEALAEHFGISLNAASGSVSTGMRRLELEGFVKPCTKRGGSNCWSLVALTAEV